MSEADLRLGNRESPILDNRMHAILKIRQVHWLVTHCKTSVKNLSSNIVLKDHVFYSLAALFAVLH